MPEVIYQGDLPAFTGRNVPIKEIASAQSLVCHFNIIVFERHTLSVRRNIHKTVHRPCIYDDDKAVFSFPNTRSVLFRVPIRTSCNNSIVRRNFCRIWDISYSFVSPLRLILIHALYHL